MTSIKNDGYGLLFVYIDPRDGERFVQVAAVDGQTHFRTKREANLACFAFAREWRMGRGSIVDFYRRLSGSEARTGFTAVKAGAWIANGRHFHLKHKNLSIPFGSIKVVENHKEVSE